MKRLIAIPLAAAMLLAAPSVFAAKLEGTATITIDDATPVYGQTITLTAQVDADGPASIRTVCTHEAGQSFGFGSISDDEILTDDVGLYAPNWPESPATCVASVTLLDYSRHGKLMRSLVIGSLTFEVAA